MIKRAVRFMEDVNTRRPMLVADVGIGTLAAGVLVALLFHVNVL